VANYYNAAAKSMRNMKNGSSEYEVTVAVVKYLGKPGEKRRTMVYINRVWIFKRLPCTAFYSAAHCKGMD